MADKIILYSIEPQELYQMLRSIVEEVIESKITKSYSIPDSLSDKTLLKPEEVCKIFRISKSTLYVWIKQGRLKSFRVRSRRYFSREDIQKLILRREPL